MHLAHYIGLIHRSESELERALREVAGGHRDEPDIAYECGLHADRARRHAERLEPFVGRYGEDAPNEPERLHHDLFGGTRTGGLGLLRDLHDLYLMACESDISWTMVGQAAQGVRDTDLLAAVTDSEQETAVLLKWLRTRMKQAAPQALVVAD